jgi:hypothetical protein
MKLFPNQAARTSSLWRRMALPLVIALVAASSGSVEAREIFKKVERGDCECWCKTSAGTYTYVDFGVTRKSCFKGKSGSCKDGQGNAGNWHGCSFTSTPSEAEFQQVNPRAVVPTDLPAATQVTPRALPADLPQTMQAE